MGDSDKPGLSRRRALKRIGAGSVVVGLAGCTGNGDDGGNGNGNGGNGNGGSDGGNGGGGTVDGGDDSGGLDQVNVAGITPSGVDDFGWSQSEYQAMERATEGMDNVELTEVVGAVAYSDTQSTLNNLVPDNDVIIVDGNGYLESGALEVSKNNPDTYFMTRNTAIPPDDLPENHVTWNNHHGMVWQAMGYAAGQVMSMEGAVEGEPKVGQVDSLPVLVRKHAVRGAMCGLMSTEADPEFLVNWINSWYAPDKTQRNAQTHVENGADVLLNGTNGAIPGQVAADNDIWAVGYGIDMSEAAPDGYATSIIMNIAPILTDGFQAALDGTWSEFWNRDENHHLWTPKYWQGEPVIEVASWHDDIPEEVQTNTQEYVEQLRNHEIEIPEIWTENECPSGESFEVSFPEN